MKEKVIIITGGTSGIGKACAVEFARRGARVVITGRDETRLADAKHEMEKQGWEMLAICADVCKEEDCRRVVDETLARFGKIDVLVNNAGISMRALFEKTELSVLRRVMDINFWGTVNSTKPALPHILKERGSIVGISSIAGYKGLPGRSGYCASKFAMHGFLESLRIENLRNGLHVLIACPGFTTSNIRNTALAADGNQQGESPRDEQKMMTAEAVAKAIALAIIRRKRSLVLTRDGKLTVFLSKFFPAWLDRLVLKHFEKNEK